MIYNASPEATRRVARAALNAACTCRSDYRWLLRVASAWPETLSPDHWATVPVMAARALALLGDLDLLRPSRDPRYI